MSNKWNIYKKKIIDYIEYDYGVNLIDVKNKIINSKAWENFKLISLCLFGIIASIVLAGSLSILTIAHPVGMFVLLYIDLLALIWVYMIYTKRISLDDIEKNIYNVKKWILNKIGRN